MNKIKEVRQREAKSLFWGFIKTIFIIIVALIIPTLMILAVFGIYVGMGMN